jgi:CRP/FNR family transcriptional regulator, cyclic AMP receptor protein
VVNAIRQAQVASGVEKIHAVIGGFHLAPHQEDYVRDTVRALQEIDEIFISHLLARTLRVEEDLVDQLFNSSEKRLARLLLLLANFGKEARPEPIIAKISQETLAEMIGTTRSRVSFFMNKFRRLGFVDYNGGGLEVHSSLLNVVLHD